MIVHFHEPPEQKRIGGLDAAIRSLEKALQTIGHTVLVNPTDLTARGDVAHFHGLWQPGFRRVASAYRATGVPYVVSPHGMLEPWAWRHKRWKKLPYWHLIEKRWVKHASCVLATAEKERRRLQTFLPATRTAAIPLGLTAEVCPDYAAARAELGWAQGERVLLFLSRIHPKKGLDLLLEAAARVPMPRMRLVIVGPEEDPVYAACCRAFAEQRAHCLPRIDWVGPVWGEKRWRYLQGADLLCLPTHSENFGLVVLEACQVGTPVLTTTETPWAEVLPERHGLIASPNVPSLTGALRRHFGNAAVTPVERDALSTWANDHYAWDGLVRQYVEVYQNAR